MNCKILRSLSLGIILGLTSWSINALDTSAAGSSVRHRRPRSGSPVDRIADTRAIELEWEIFTPERMFGATMRETLSNPKECCNLACAFVLMVGTLKLAEKAYVLNRARSKLD